MHLFCQFYLNKTGGKKSVKLSNKQSTHVWINKLFSICLTYFANIVLKNKRNHCCRHLLAKSYPTLRNPMDCSLPGSSVCVISQAEILDWGAISFSRWSFQLRDKTHFLLHWQADSSPLSHQGSPKRYICILFPIF